MKDFFSGLLMADLSPEQRTAVWRIAMTFLVMGHVAWACGWLPGLPGFAMVPDVEAKYEVLAAEYRANHQRLVDENQRLSDGVSSLEVSLLEKDIIEAQERFCQAQASGNHAAQRYAEERRRRLLQEWLEMKGTPFDLPSCAELGIVA